MATQPKSPKSPKRPTQRKVLAHKSLSTHQAKLLIIAATAVIVILLLMVYQTIYASTERPQKTLNVHKGESYHSILMSPRWSDAPLSSDLLTRIYIALHAKKPLQEGGYEIPAGASLSEVLSILIKGSEVETFNLLILEGRTTKDLYNAIKNIRGVKLEVLTPPADGYSWADVARDNEAVAAALGVDAPNHNMEGWFAANTYRFARGTSDLAILRRLYNDQNKLLDEAWANRDKELPYKTPYEALIMASIIEKETGVAAERGLVSAVFVNRLRKGMRLQTDPTIIYGLFDRYDGTIYRSNIQEKTAYNTYQIYGLPPTPIAIPSKAAIEAAMHPHDSDMLYFVATGNGGHKFSRTYEEHQKAVEEYRAVMRQKNSQ